jgi:RnfABCDGE-type electron transport complex B subunit
MKKDEESIIISNQVALIQEADCIGCTKCIQVCPVDAIMGAAKQMHSVIKDECTGCALCINSCPVTCITLLPTENMNNTDHKQKIIQAKKRIEFRNFRLKRNEEEKIKKREITKTLHNRKIFIQEAFLRVQEKKRIMQEKNNMA